MLNLLPEEVKSRHKTRSKLYSVVVAYIVVGAAFILGPVAVSTYNLILGSEADDYQSKIDQINNQIGRSSEISDKLAFLESRLTDGTQFQEQRQWENYLTAIAQSIPSDVTLTNLHLEKITDPKTPVMSVAGTTADRRAVLLFRDKLLEGKSFKNATITAINEAVVDNAKRFTFVISLGVGDV